MAKINTANIEGFADMTPEQQLEAVLAYEYEDHTDDWQKAKNALSKANSEAAEWKKKHNALLSEDEQTKQAKEEELQTLKDQLSDLKKRESIAKYTAKFAELGYSAELAKSSAEAYLKKDDDDLFFANHKKFMEEHDKAYKAQLMSSGSKPPAGVGSSPMTLDTLRKMSPSERLAYSQEHPEEYKQIYGGTE